jgi:hypothetical protein
MEDCKDTHAGGCVRYQASGKPFLGRALPLPKLSPALGRTDRDLHQLQREPSRFH